MADRLQRFNLAGVEVILRSVAGIGTTIVLPKLRMVVDLGHCFIQAIQHQHVFITHGHMDHCAAVPMHAYQRSMMKLPPSVVYAPPYMVEPLTAAIKAFQGTDLTAIPCSVVPIAPGQVIPHPGLQNVMIEAFATKHRVPSQGYIVWRVKAKLKPEYADLTPAEIAVLRKDRVVTEDHKVAEVAVTGDTSIDGITESHLACTAKLLITECTSVDAQLSEEVCRSRGHIHVSDLAGAADSLTNEAILLMHFSGRYSADDIRTMVRKQLPPALLAKVAVADAAHVPHKIKDGGLLGSGADDDGASAGSDSKSQG